MTRPRIAIATCRPLPEPDPDEAPLLAALADRGLDPVVAPWRDAGIDYAACALCVVRSTWDYPTDPTAFRQWIDRVSRHTRLVNPPDILRWNLHKGYLQQLEHAGIPTVPTVWSATGDRTPLAALLADHDWTELVIKPAISAGSWRTRRFAHGERAAAERFLDTQRSERDMMIQPHLAAFESPGERAVVWIDGHPTHRVLKAPRFAHGVERVSNAEAVRPAEQALGERVLARVPATDPLLYARIDVVEHPPGTLCISELELVEPSLFLHECGDALERLVDGIVTRLR